MSWEKFEKLSISKQKQVLRDVFLHSGLMYTINTKKGRKRLENEYKTYDCVRLFVNDAMKRVI